MFCVSFYLTSLCAQWCTHCFAERLDGDKCPQAPSCRWKERKRREIMLTYLLLPLFLNCIRHLGNRRRWFLHATVRHCTYYRATLPLNAKKVVDNLRWCCHFCGCFCTFYFMDSFLFFSFYSHKIITVYGLYPSMFLFCVFWICAIARHGIDTDTDREVM